jgi:hypothetical protein
LLSFLKSERLTLEQERRRNEDRIKVIIFFILFELGLVEIFGKIVIK